MLIIYNSIHHNKMGKERNILSLYFIKINMKFT